MKEPGNFLTRVVAVGAIVTAISLAGIMRSVSENYSFFYKTPASETQEGFVAPEDIRIHSADRDEGKGQETYFTDYGSGRNFVIMRDEEGNPVLKGYTRQPARIVPEGNEGSKVDSE
jgi:hypothetical protein